MDRQQTGFGRTTATWIILVIAGAVLAVAGYYYFTKTPSEDETPPPPPSTEWTTAPEGGVAVDLPETPMTNIPPEQPETAQEGRPSR